ncbi:MAG: helix-turn-helix domain-containing protein [Fimbriimonadaceae bacterium]|nr:helix-turn-helix domain-containing protein [Fimbriimonadaceae bacterium]
MAEERQRYLIRGPQSDRLSSYIERYRPCTSVPVHDHKTPYVSFVLVGGYDEWFGQQKYECREGTLTIHPAGDRHSNTIFGMPTREMYFSIHPNLYSSLSQVGLLQTRTDTRRADLSQLMQKAIREVAEPDSLSVLILESLVVEAVVTAQRLARTCCDAPRWPARVEEYLRSHLHTEPCLGEVEREFGRDGSYLARIFRQHYGVTMGDFVRSLRVEQALRMLSSTEQSIGEISAELGFSDQSHFGRVFRRHTGMTPLAYRKTTSNSRFRTLDLN